jgi:hypothetical protein
MPRVCKLCVTELHNTNKRTICQDCFEKIGGPLCPKCKENPRKLCPLGYSAYCTPCGSKDTMTRNRALPGFRSEKAQVATHCNYCERPFGEDREKKKNMRICVECSKEYARWMARARRSYHLGECCDICGTNERLCIDHKHHKDVDKRYIRGTLCISCNSGLGGFCDSVEKLEKAIEYLKITKKDL